MIDAEGREIGSAPRATCHADPSLIHPSVHVVVITGSGCLWQLRGYGKDSAPGHWDHACSGHVSLGENARTAAVRELGEEIGVVVDGGALEQVARVLCELGNETELTTIFRLAARRALRSAAAGGGRARGATPRAAPRAALPFCASAGRPARRRAPRLGRLRRVASAQPACG